MTPKISDRLKLYRGVNIKNPPLSFFSAKIFKRSFIFHKIWPNASSTLLFFTKFDQMFGLIFIVFGPFFERFPLSNTQKAQKIRLRRFLSDPAYLEQQGGYCPN